MAAAAALDLAPFINQTVLPLLTSAAVALVGFLATKLATYFHFQISEGQRAILATALTNGIAYAQKKVAPNEVLSTSAAVTSAVSYVTTNVPGVLAWLKITPASLEQLILARL